MGGEPVKADFASVSLSNRICAQQRDAPTLSYHLCTAQEEIGHQVGVAGTTICDSSHEVLTVGVSVGPGNAHCAKERRVANQCIEAGTVAIQKDLGELERPMQAMAVRRERRPSLV